MCYLQSLSPHSGVIFVSARSPAAPGPLGAPYLACSASIRVSATRELILSFPKAAEVSALGVREMQSRSATSLLVSRWRLSRLRQVGLVSLISAHYGPSLMQSAHNYILVIPVGDDGCPVSVDVSDSHLMCR